MRAHGAVGDPVTIRYAVSMETSTQNGSGDRSIPPNDSLGGIKANKDNDPYGLSPMKALREFLNSETRSMLENPDLELWAFSPLILFDMWKAEKVTGDPRNSVYIRED